MSTNKSQNLNLHLWEPKDDFLRTEFNENFAALDTAVKAEQEARIQAVNADRASISAVQALANQALADANLTRYVFGGYYGKGLCGSDQSITLELGFRPSVFIVFCGDKDVDYPAMVYAAEAGLRPKNSIEFTVTDTGVSWYTIYGAALQMNQSNHLYFYLALR